MTSEMGEIWNEHRAIDKERRQKNLQQADPSEWTIHTQYHWSQSILGERLDYWPSRNKFQYKGRIYTGDVDGYIRNIKREHGYK